MQHELKEKAKEFYWHHSVDLGDGFVTDGAKSAQVCGTEAALIFDRVKMDGASVLDIGAWNGYFSFEAKRRGASRVLATDSLCWTDSKKRGRESFDFSLSRNGLDVEAEEIDAGKISLYTVGKFDVVLYLGVFYHRRDAIESLPRIATSTKQLLVVETQLDFVDIETPALAYYPADEMSSDASNWWGPNAHFMKAFLLGMGFSLVEVTQHPIHKRRAIFHAWRSTELRDSAIEISDVCWPVTTPVKAKEASANVEAPRSDEHKPKGVFVSAIGRLLGKTP